MRFRHMSICDEHALSKWYSEVIFKLKSFDKIQNVI